MDFFCAAMGLAVFILGGYVTGLLTSSQDIWLYLGVGFSLATGLTAFFACKKKDRCLRVAAIASVMLFVLAALELLFDAV